MLARLPSSLPRAASSLSRGTAPSIQRFPSCARFHSSDAAPAPTPDVQASSEVQAEPAPKKRVIPLAETLGDISISKKRSQGKNWGPRMQAWEGGGDRQRQGRPPRRDNDFRRDGQAQTEPRPLRSRPAYTVSRPIAPRQWQENAMPSEDAAETVAETQEVKDVPVTHSPAHPKVHLGNLDELFGSAAPLAASSVQHYTSKAREVTPSQARVQLLLERTGGDYSRYVPRPFPNTTVKELGPLGVAEFTLAYRPDVTPRSRQNVLAVVKKFTDRGAQATAA